MSTLVQTRVPLQSLSMSQQPERRRSSRLASYDQSDGDFQFMRGSKRKKPEDIPDEPVREKKLPSRSTTKSHDDQPAPDKKPRRQMVFDSPIEHTEIQARKTKKSTRRSTRLSSDKKEDETMGSESSRPQRKETEATQNSTKPFATTTTGNATPASNQLPKVKEPTTIALPMSDTPVISRNREMRKKSLGARRSSLGLRGRRASSLIDNGHSAIPHREVEASEFYKHIGADGLPEPRRMKQLLIWCGERALGDKPGHNMKDADEILAARAIKQALLKDFSNRTEMWDWFSREDSAVPAVVVKKPNPLNIQNASKIEELEERIRRLKEERAQWKALEKDLPSRSSTSPSDSEPTSASVDRSLLDQEQANILASLASTTPLHTSVSARLQAVQSGLEFQVDKFADGVHRLDQFRTTADRLATRVLGLSATRVNERDAREKEAIGTSKLPIQEVLRSLSRILNDNSGASASNGVGNGTGSSSRL